MPVNKRDVVRIVKAGASAEAQKNAMLAIAGDKPSLWDGLDAEDVLGVLKQGLTQLEKGPEKLTLLQLVDTPAQAFVYASPPRTSTSMLSQHLRHVPDQVLPWLGVEEQACALREKLPATPAVYECYRPAMSHPYDEGTCLMLLDETLFTVANRLGSVPGLAPINFSNYAGGFGLAVTSDRVWTCNGQVIGMAEGKQPGSRPALLGHKLVEQYKPDKPSARATAQLQQVCGQLHYGGLKYGVLYTDECFWFLRYDADSAPGTLYVSEGIMVSRTHPTLLLMLLFVGKLAEEHAAKSVPSITCRQSLPLVLAFLGGFHSLISRDSSPKSLPHQLRLGPLLGQGSTGSVRLGRSGNVDLAVKLFEEGVDATIGLASACQRLQLELDLYQSLLHPLQGVSVPRLMASGTVEGPNGTRQPLFALELLPVSLADVEAPLGACECDHVLVALNSIHQQGVLHGDIEPRHVVYSSLNTLAEPKWIDFSNASRARSNKELADEAERCRDMLQQLHKIIRRPHRLHRSSTARGVCQAAPQLPCVSCVLTT